MMMIIIIIIIIPDTTVLKIEPDIIFRDNGKGTWDMSVNRRYNFRRLSTIKKKEKNFKM